MTRRVAFLPEHLRREIVLHCRGALPNEGCGLVAVADGSVVKVYPTSNADSSPSSFTIPPEEHFEALTDAESNGWELGGVFHSHPSGPSEMSAVDRSRALEPDWTYFVVGLADGQEVVAGYTL